MKNLILLFAATVLVGCSNGTRMADVLVPPSDEKLITDSIVETAVRKSLKKPEGELTEADLGNVIELILTDTQITDAGLKDLVKLQKLNFLDLTNTQITDTGLKEAAKLQKLQRLNLNSTLITDEGFKEVAKLGKKMDSVGKIVKGLESTLSAGKKTGKVLKKVQEDMHDSYAALNALLTKKDGQAGTGEADDLESSPEVPQEGTTHGVIS